MGATGTAEAVSESRIDPDVGIEVMESESLGCLMWSGMEPLY